MPEELFNTIEECVEHFEREYDPDLARILVRTRLRSRSFKDEDEGFWLAEKLSILEGKCESKRET